jgi:hypothetical protein
VPFARLCGSSQSSFLLRRKPARRFATPECVDQLLSSSNPGAVYVKAPRCLCGARLQGTPAPRAGGR